MRFAAARNNAEWCDTVCRTHGAAGRFGPRAWTSALRTPPLYPDAVTLQPDARADEVLAAVDTSDGCSVKDSFARLDLEPEGFRELFRAEWVCREAPPQRTSDWSVVTTPSALGEWEGAWGDTPGTFRSALLADAAVAVLARYDGDRAVAGAIARRSATVIGISNLFGDDLEATWDGAVGAAAWRFGSLPVVGYDAGESLQAARSAGFETLGELVVWIR